MGTAEASFVRSTIGLKIMMAVTGAILIGFSIAHMVGTAQIFLGAEAVNSYAALLRKVPALLWAARIVLIASTVIHISSAIILARRNQSARQSSYAFTKSLATDYAARTMIWSGPLVFFFLVYHLAHFTFGHGPNFDHQNPFNNMVYAFQVPWITILYVIANIIFGLHLYHGAWSWLQTLGITVVSLVTLKRIAGAVTLLVIAGYVAQPLAVLMGAIEPTTEEFCFPELAEEPGECPLAE
jgi:succinate dehydrogenase / fumarate reductase cytochrome b subunit